MPVASSTTSLPIILQRLHQKYPGARYELDWETPVQLLVATILAAQCTDERVNKVTKTLFVKYHDAKAYANADISVLEEDLKPTGFYREKDKKVQNACKDLVANFGGEVPKTMDEMLTLYGVARALGKYLLEREAEPRVLIGMDTRESGPHIAAQLAVTLRKTQIEDPAKLAGLLTLADAVTAHQLAHAFGDGKRVG